jgi:hypothetical protein
MALYINGIILDELSADPGAPVEGEFWYNTTEKRFKYFRNGSIESVLDKDEFDAHLADLANPHDTDLEEARTAGNVLSGEIDMGTNKIINMGSPTVGGDAAEFQWVLDQIKSKIQGLDWKESVLDKDILDPPGVPALGDRYLINGVGINGWVGKDNQIAEWDGAAWVYTVPNEGATTMVEDENKFYTFDGATWALWETTQDHGQLLGLGDDDHVQYILVNGARAFTGSINMGGFNITNVGTVDGVTVSAHAARHLTGGADEVDGDKLDIDWTPTNYTPTVAPAEVDSLDNLTAHLAGIDAILAGIGGGLVQKAGSALAGGFAGSPKKITVTFSAAFADANYAVTLTPVTTSNGTFSPAVESKVAGSFVINLGSSGVVNLTSIDWVALKHGES